MSSEGSGGSCYQIVKMHQYCNWPTLEGSCAKNGVRHSPKYFPSVSLTSCQSYPLPPFIAHKSHLLSLFLTKAITSFYISISIAKATPSPQSSPKPPLPLLLHLSKPSLTGLGHLPTSLPASATHSFISLSCQSAPSSSSLLCLFQCYFNGTEVLRV